MNLNVYAGASFKQGFRWKAPDTGAGQNLTAWSAKMRIGPPGGKAVLELSNGSGITLNSTGLILIEMSATATAALPAASWTYTLDMIDPSGFVIRFLHGDLEVVHELDPATP
jgi:hypothetical protein